MKSEPIAKHSNGRFTENIDMNELEKAVPAEETVKPTEAVCSIEETVETTNESADESTRVNFHSMDKNELTAQLREILADGRMDAHREVSLIKQLFFNIRSREHLEEIEAFVEAGNDPKDFASQPDELENEFKTLYADFKERRAAHLEAEEQRRAANLAEKNEIIERIKAISEDIDNINTKFPEFQQLQQDFKVAKEIPATAETDVWKRFQLVVEQFYDHLKVNKELRDLDFKKNLEAKQAIVESAKALESAPDPVAAFRQLQSLHDEWRNIGPVAKELRESLWDEFKAASTVVNRRHQDYFEQRKAAELANETGKTTICEEMEAINLATLTSFNAWSEMTEKVIELQKRWKELGFASKKNNTVLYNRFRKACDDFFAAKTEYFQKTKDEFSQNLEKKTALCERAEALKAKGDHRGATAEIVKLQAEWKSIGSVPRKVSDAIWQRFQTACNEVFAERKQKDNAKRNEENANLEAKRAVVAKIAALPLDGTRNEVIPQLKELQNEWQEIGHVPFKMKDKAYTEYRAAVDAVYGAYEAKENRARMNNYKEQVRDLKNDDRKLGREREKLQRALESRRQDLKTIENNMGFFNVKSSAGNSMIREMENRIAKLKEDIAQISEKLSLLEN